jgi:hypothetical protein
MVPPSGYIKSQNSRIWSGENPHTFHERPLHFLKVEYVLLSVEG